MLQAKGVAAGGAPRNPPGFATSVRLKPTSESEATRKPNTVLTIARESWCVLEVEASALGSRTWGCELAFSP